MNRLIIVGNGFDLAHGLPTSYRDFIDDYWKTACDTKGGNEIKYQDDLVEINCRFGYSINQFGESIRQYEFSSVKSIINYKELKLFIDRNRNERKDGFFEISFANKFFEIICNITVEKWVDIENVYYDILKEGAKGNFIKHNYPWDITQLNVEFEQVKNLLEKYLTEKVVDCFDFQNIGDNEFFELFFPDIMHSQRINRWSEDFSNEDQKYIASTYQGIQNGLKINVCFLCFNYTPTLNKYIENLKSRGVQVEINFIHGELGNNYDNKINFGFGDEMDEDYKLIENIDDNKYLKNFKSFHYFQNSNYKRLLDFIGGFKYEVYMVGHSCGLSDRTLLNTIFENENCRSIKVLYHRKDDNDNFTDLVQNISRHFNDKSLMRSKIAHKKSEFETPQPKISKKKQSVLDRFSKALDPRLD